MILFEGFTLLQPIPFKRPILFDSAHVIHFLVGGRLEGKERKEWEEDGRNAGRCMIVEGKKGMEKTEGILDGV